MCDVVLTYRKINLTYSNDRLECEVVLSKTAKLFSFVSAFSYQIYIQGDK